MLPNGYVSDVKKIAVLRCNALGDCVVTLPALSALKRAYPQVEIVYLGKKWHEDFFHGRNIVDRVVEVPILHGIRDESGKEEDLSEKKRFIEQLQAERFDIVFQWMGAGETANPFVNSLNARVTVGLKGKNSHPTSRWLPFFYYQNEVIRFGEMTRLVGAPIEEYRPRVPVLRGDKLAAQAFLENITRPFVVLHLGAQDMRRIWAVEKFIQVAEILSERGYDIVLTGTAQEHEYISDFVQKCSFTVHNLSGVLSLSALIGVLSEAEVCVSNDTGVMHISYAVGTKTVGLMWAPNVTNWAPLFRDTFMPVISWQLPCSLCGIIPNDPYPFMPQDTCKHLVSFVDGITVEQVVSALDVLRTPQKGTV